MTPFRVLDELAQLADSRTTEEIRINSARLLRTTRRVSDHLRKAIDETSRHLWDLAGSQTDSESRNRLEIRRQDLWALLNAVDDLLDYVSGPNGSLLSRQTSMLLLGSWGTGKTHFLCDMARKRLASGKPALLVLASSLPPGVNALDGIAQSTRLASTSNGLLAGLEKLGRQTSSRALLMIDAINEGDRDTWRRELPRLARQIRAYPHVALVVSCRRPFDHLIVTKRAAKLYVQLDHPGFEEQEFDAQLEFFAFYGIPAPPVPLITPEFSRPLFLKLLCEAIAGLSKRPQTRTLREIASGQKGMTYVFEHFAKKIGDSVEADFRLPRKSCWSLLKGSAGSGKRGLAGLMADRGREWLRREEAVNVIRSDLQVTSGVAKNFLKRLVTEGLLAEDVRWLDNDMEEVVQFGYQRFGDHLVARHLLDAHLNTRDETSIRRCFYAGRKLGDVFQLDSSSSEFRSPGIAGAIMLELPERLKRSSLPHELIGYLPKARRLVSAIKDVFLEGLYWRSTSSFNDETHRIINFLLEDAGKESRNETLEVLVGLASRPNHPYSAVRLRSYLVPLPMPERDVIWSDFLRVSHEHATAYRLLVWVESGAEKEAGADSLGNYIRLLSLFLTTTKRPLRDRATRALFLLGVRQPGLLFSEVLASLDFDDPYVPERMLAAAYGMTMHLWASPDGADLREAIVPFARDLVRAMFLPRAPHATWHVLMRDYALGIIELARRIDRAALSTQHVHHLRASRPRSPFKSSARTVDAEVQDARRAMHMDFENYTLGRLVPDRGNYQDSHREYQLVRRQVAQRMVDLGYSSDRFDELDRQIVNFQSYSRAEDGGKTERYGKKYSWIPFFEMYGLRASQGRLEDRRIAERTSDCDIDPSFPERATAWSPTLSGIFRQAPRKADRWLRYGPVPDYRRLLVRKTVGDVGRGPWVLLDGYVNQGGSYNREAVTFIRGVLIEHRHLPALAELVRDSEYMGNYRIPDASSDYYTFAGEIPWSRRFGTDLRRSDGSAKRSMDRAFLRYVGGRWVGVPVEIPVQRWAWESYHSTLNQVGQVTVPAPAVCEALGLTGRGASWDLYDARARAATLYREFSAGPSRFPSHLLYIRADLIRRYLDRNQLVLVWIPWGERSLHWKDLQPDRPPAIESALQDHANDFASLIPWTG